MTTGYHLRENKKASPDNRPVWEQSSALALEALALLNIHDVLGFAMPAEQMQLVRRSLRQDLD